MAGPNELSENRQDAKGLQPLLATNSENRESKSDRKWPTRHAGTPLARNPATGK